MHDKISLAGDLGSGKSTVAKILTERLGMEYYSTGRICRAVATRHGIDVEHMNTYMEAHPELDKEIDDGLRALSQDERPLLIDSRMAWHFVEGTFRVYLTTETAVSAARIFHAGRAEESFATVEETEASIRKRRQSESKRYKELYGVNNHDLNNYDLVLDTTYASPEEIAACLGDAFAAWQQNRQARFCFLSPLRLYYPAELPQSDLDPAALAERIEAGDERPVVDVQFDGERFCVTSDPTIALAYSLSALPLIPCRLLPGAAKGEFVRMCDSL